MALSAFALASASKRAFSAWAFFSASAFASASALALSAFSFSDWVLLASGLVLLVGAVGMVVGLFVGVSGELLPQAVIAKANAVNVPTLQILENSIETP